MSVYGRNHSLFICAILLAALLASVSSQGFFSLLNSRESEDRANLKGLHDIWGPVIHQVGIDAFQQLQNHHSQDANKPILRRFDASDTRVADGVLFSIGIELDYGQRVDFSLLDFAEPYSMFLAPGDSPQEIKKKESTNPTFGDVQFQGPLEIYFPKNRELRLKVPKSVDPGSVRRVFIDHGVAVNGSGYCQMRLLNSLEVEKFSIVEQKVQRPPSDAFVEPDSELASLVADVQLPDDDETELQRKLVFSYRGTPELMLLDEEHYRPDRLVADAATLSETSSDEKSKEFSIESNSALKVKRGSGKHDIILTSPLKQQKESELHEIEFPISPSIYPAIQQLLAQLAANGKGVQNIRRIRSATAEAVKVFFIPMEVETDDIAFWHVLAVRTIEGKTKLMNYRRVPQRIESSFSHGIMANDTVSVQREMASIVAALPPYEQAKKVEQQEKAALPEAESKQSTENGPRSTEKSSSDAKDEEEKRSTVQKPEHPNRSEFKRKRRNT